MDILAKPPGTLDILSKPPDVLSGLFKQAKARAAVMPTRAW
ncbi:MAG: hypothetical protein ACHQIO_08345 [Nevskiales bacterium]